MFLEIKYFNNIHFYDSQQNGKNIIIKEESYVTCKLSSNHQQYFLKISHPQALDRQGYFQIWVGKEKRLVLLNPSCYFLVQLTRYLAL